MALLTYAGNLDNDFVSSVTLKDGRTMNIGDSLDIPDADVPLLSTFMNLVPGRIAVDLSKVAAWVFMDEEPG